MTGDTITAIATASGRGGVAVIRVSGPEAFAVAEKIAGTVPAPGRFRFATFRDSENPNSQTPQQPNILDAGLVLAFKGPHSYTGEDVVEFQCHGGSVAPRRVLEACLRAGARLARRGEFTERAFLNGRLDYDQAESVLDLIDAKTDRAAAAALEGLSGRKTRALRSLYDSVLTLSSTVEHALDVDEGELPDGFAEGLERELGAIRTAFAQALVRAREGKMLREGALVVLVGAPNAGKSSLLNALLGESRAIVSPIAGTTRDTIEEWLDLGGWPVRLVDTAGLRKTDDAIEAEGVRRAEDLIAKADVVVRLVEVEGVEEVSEVEDVSEIVVLSKCDLLSTPRPSSPVPPTYLHVTLVVGPDGNRLAKRHGDTRMATYREEGLSPKQVLGFLAAACGWCAPGESVSLRDLLPRFTLDTIPHAPFVICYNHRIMQDKECAGA